MKKLYQIAAVVLLLANFTSFKAQATAAGCDPCQGAAWSSTAYLSFTFTIPYRPGCTYNAYVVYKTRTCNGLTEISVAWDSTIFEQLDTAAGTSCGPLSCPPDCANMQQIVYNQIMATTGPSLKIEPSPCFYLGTIVVPPGAEACYGMTPGSIRYVILPCDTTGCCLAEITPIVGSTSYNQHVLSSTDCPPSAYIPDSVNIGWSCDIGGGMPGSISFTVVFTAANPHVCQRTCAEGLIEIMQKNSAPTSVNTVNSTISGFKVYPNPVTDELHIGFNSFKNDETINVVYNVAGQKVAGSTFKTTMGQQKIDINTHDMAPGTYNCYFKFSGGIIDTKFTK